RRRPHHPGHLCARARAAPRRRCRCADRTAADLAQTGHGVAGEHAAFVSLDPEKLSDGFQALRVPAVVGFGVSYGYRMVPLLVTEFQTIVDGHRLRGAPPRGHGFLGWRTF